MAWKTDARGRRSLACDARSPLPVLQVNLVHPHLLLEGRNLLVDDLVFVVEVVHLVIAARIVAPDARDDPVGDSDDQAKPHDGESLEEEEHRQERPPDRVVIADQSLGVPERLKHVHDAPVGGDFERADDIGANTGVAAVRHKDGRVVVYGPADHEVEEVAGNEP